MNYPQTLDYLFNALPMFQRIGASAFRKDLGNTFALCRHLSNPQLGLKCIHVAGTNGKGSSSHALASVLQEAGYKVGLYTSPHLKSFTERIKINGMEIPEQDVVDFVSNNKNFLESLKLSFFEMTVGMAFWHFAKEKVDYAVVEVGMGGKYDSTNVLNPILCLITNIGLDHVQFLGETLPEIAGEKAGIIKKGVPVVISERQVETEMVFLEKALAVGAPIYFAEDSFRVQKNKFCHSGKSEFNILHNSEKTLLEMDLVGNYQAKNLGGVLKAIEILQLSGTDIPQVALESGLQNIVKNTGLKGRWQTLQEKPYVICDTAHNAEGINYIVDQLSDYIYNELFIILGMVNDKDVLKVLSLFPKNAKYFFCQASIPRAMPAKELSIKAESLGLKGIVVADVNDALEEAKKMATEDDLIFIGGSTFVVAEIKDL